MNSTRDKVKERRHSNCVNGTCKEISAGRSMEGKVLVLYTGGTIGMIRNENQALVPFPNVFVKKLRLYPHMHDREYAEETYGPMGPLVLPVSENNSRRVVYSVIEYSPLCDSSNMTMDDWIRIAKDIKQSYEYFDGFIVLHGTDTLSYTASALSYMLEALGKIVIVTGSQVPIFEARSDGMDNFLTSLIIAANYSIPEVCVFFNKKLMRGNRTIKTAASSFEAFDSPNFPPLAKAEINIEVNYRLIFRPCNIEKFNVHSSLNRNVGLLRLFPGITSDLIKAFFQSPIEGVVLQTYGAGNVPANRKDIMDEFRAATERGVIIVNVTQCNSGTVSSLYEPAKLLEDAGVIMGFDLTPEAALTKLAYVLSKKDWSIEMKKDSIQINLRGELSNGKVSTIQDLDLVEAVASSLRISSAKELQELGSILFPAMLNAAVLRRDVKKLESLKRCGADISQQNADGRTALHIACREGDLKIVQSLLKMGASVHIQDRFGRTPLTEAIENDHHEIIKILLQCGAHLHEYACLIGEKMCVAAATGSVRRLKSFQIAGADLSVTNLIGMTPLHFAAIYDKLSVAIFLLENGANASITDKTNCTPFDLAVMTKSNRVLEHLRAYE